jgi:hypothetical protein
MALRPKNQTTKRSSDQMTSRPDVLDILGFLFCMNHTVTTKLLKVLLRISCGMVFGNLKCAEIKTYYTSVWI